MKGLSNHSFPFVYAMGFMVQMFHFVGGMSEADALMMGMMPSVNFLGQVPHLGSRAWCSTWYLVASMMPNVT